MSKRLTPEQKRIRDIIERLDFIESSAKLIHVPPIDNSQEYIDLSAELGKLTNLTIDKIKAFFTISKLEQYPSPDYNCKICAKRLSMRFNGIVDLLRHLENNHKKELA